VILLCAAAKPEVSASASSVPASRPNSFFIGFLHSVAGNIVQRNRLEKATLVSSRPANACCSAVPDALYSTASAKSFRQRIGCELLANTAIAN
jgi:hypothetical protein